MSSSPALLEVLLSQPGTLEQLIGAGQYRDDRTLPVNNLNLKERRSLISAVGLSTPLGEIVQQQQLVRYILEAEYWKRNLAPERTQRIWGQMYKYTQLHSIATLTEKEKAMTTETILDENETTEAAGSAKAKRVRKPAAVKKAAKNAEKAAGKKGAAKKASKNAAANEERKTRLAAKKKDVPERTRISDPSLTEVKLQKMADEGTQPKQAMQILALLKEGGRKMQLDALYKAMGKAITTKQPIERIFAFYKKALMDAGHITVTIAAQ